MNTDILQLFSTPVYTTSFPRDFNNSEIDSYNNVINNQLDNNSENLISKDKYVLDNIPELSDIKEFIRVHVNQYALKSFGKTRKQDIFVTTSWINLTKPGMRHHLHKHPNSILSGVFYFETIENDCILFRKEIISSSISFSHKITEHNNFYGDIVSMKIHDGFLVIFPSNLFHEVPTNKTEDNRISLSFNTWVKGEFLEETSRLVI